MAKNETGLLNSFNERSDWIEIFNPTESTVSLEEWSLTDDAADLTKWQFPAGVAIGSGDYLVVFASGRDVNTPGGELHTNFKLSGSGEYLALVKSNGSTISHEFVPDYPQQYADYSFGMTQDFVQLVGGETDLRYHIPTAVDAGADWTGSDFDDSAWLGKGTQSPILISEAGTDSRDYIEIQNTSDQVVVTDGWLVVLNDPLEGVNGLHSKNWELPPTMAPGEVLYRTDYFFDFGHYFGTSIQWDPGENGWAMIVDDAGHVADFVGWEYTEAELSGLGFTIDSFDISIGNSWSGPGVANSTATNSTARRAGSQDHDNASDFAFVDPMPGDLTSPENVGEQNPNIVLPITGDRLAGVGYNTGAAGLFDGTVETDVVDTMLGQNASLWTRHEFNMDDPSTLTGLYLRIQYNDGFVAYLNGQEIQRANTLTEDPPVWNSTAQTPRTAEESSQRQMFDLSDSLQHLLVGPNVLAIQGLNISASDSSFLLVSELVATESDAVERFFAIPTPGNANEGSLLAAPSEPQFSHEHGFFDGPFQLEILPPNILGPTIIYTLDGSAPTEDNGTVYAGPLTIDSTTVIRAITYGDLSVASPIATQTYLFPADIITQSANGLRPGPEWPSGSVNGQIINYGMDPDIVGNNRTWGPDSTTVAEALMAIPTMSIVTDIDNLFDSGTGIFVNARSDGSAWERPASLELIYPDGASGPGFPDVVDATPDDGFQIDMGLRIRGGYSRSDNNPKHAFRFFFKGDYDGELQYPLFGDEGTDEFTNVDLRTSQNYSWAFSGNDNNTMVREVISRDIQGAMGQPYTRSRYYHLYLNGQYWGVFQTQERSEANFNASYLGGIADDYDVVKQNGNDGRRMFATDGNMDAYTRLWQETLNGFSDNADYFRVQGLNPDGTPNPAYEKLLDVDNLIDYMIITYYTGDRDGPGSRYTGPRPNNFWGSYDREDPDGFKFFEHDSEHSFGVPGNADNMVSPLISNQANRDRLENFNAHWLHEQLAFDNEEYVMRFADRLHKAFFNDGVLSYGAVLSQINYRATQIDKAIIAESARWGDSKLSTPRTYNDWKGAVDEVRTWIGNRTTTVINQVRNLSYAGKTFNWYPSVPAPELSRHGGEVAAGSTVTLAVPSGSIVYYTLDGSDPRLVDGAVSPSATIYDRTPIALTESTLFRARALKNGEWSASTEAQFLIGTPAAAANLLISELNYNPYTPTPGELTVYNGFGNDDFEFVEIYNASEGPVDLTGARFTDGIAFEFGSDGGPLGPGESVVVVNNVPAFEARYGTSAKETPIRIAGQYRRSFSNAGEGITLVDRFGEIILDFNYNDTGRWPGRADGTGSSLTLSDPAAVPTTEPERTDYLEDGDSWRSSIEYGGSPGVDAMANVDQVVVNEVASHSHDPDIDTIELLNVTDGPIDIGGWYLSDSNNNLMKYRIEENTILQAGEYRLFDEDDFNLNVSGGADPLDYPNEFSLNGAHGDDVWLMKADATGLTQFADHVEFRASSYTETLGRWPDGQGPLVPMAEMTLGSENTGPRIGPVVISEVHYHPTIPDNNDHEFVEIYNSTAQPVDLTDWRLRGGIDFDFPVDLTLPALSALVVVSFDPDDPDNAGILADFRATFGIDASVALVGGFSNKLDNGGDSVRLLRPEDHSPLGEDDFIPHFLEDQVIYDDVAPWPTAADGLGDSLQRLGADRWGNDPASWRAATPNPGSIDAGGATVVDHHIFYNGSAFDGSNLEADADDDLAIAPDKTVLLPNQTATQANYTNYDRGINGLMIDIRGLADAGALNAEDDFRFHVGNSSDPATWTAGPLPESITVRPGAGTDGSDRVTIIFADNAIEKQWLQVTVLVTDNTGLAAPDLFFVGNAIGEAGDQTINAIVNATDEIAARNFRHGPLQPAGIDDPYDYNRDRLVDGGDQIIARNNQTNPLTMLRLITAPAADALLEGKSTEAESASSEQPSSKLDWLYEFDQISQEESTPKQRTVAEEAVDKLLATDGF